jgi:hypothetical protein
MTDLETPRELVLPGQLAWPPPVLPVNKTNETAQLDDHPNAHNEANAAINNIVARMSAPSWAQFRAANDSALIAGGGVKIPWLGTRGDGTIGVQNNDIYVINAGTYMITIVACAYTNAISADSPWLTLTVTGNSGGVAVNEGTIQGGSYKLQCIYTGIWNLAAGGGVQVLASGWFNAGATLTSVQTFASVHRV